MKRTKENEWAYGKKGKRKRNINVCCNEHVNRSECTQGNGNIKSDDS